MSESLRTRFRGVAGLPGRFDPQTAVLMSRDIPRLNMGFGSYDESEQQDQNVDTSEDDGVTVHETEFEGEIEFDANASTDELVDKLGEIKDAN